MPFDNMLSTTEVAAKLGITRWRVFQLIRAGRLPAKALDTPRGKTYLVDPKDLACVENRPNGYPKGRPRKTISPGE